MSHMKFCPSCGHRIKGNEAFCAQCGYPLSAHQEVPEDEGAPGSERNTYEGNHEPPACDETSKRQASEQRMVQKETAAAAAPSDASPVVPSETGYRTAARKRNPVNRAVGWTAAAVVLALVIGSYFFGNYYFSAGRQVKQFKSAMTHQDASAAAYLMTTDNGTVEATEANVKPLVDYFSKHQDARKQVDHSLDRQANEAENSTSPETKNDIVNLIYDGKKWGLFDSWKLEAKTYTASLDNPTGLDVKDLKLDGSPVSSDSGEITGLVGIHHLTGTTSLTGIGDITLNAPVTLEGADDEYIDIGQTIAHDEKLNKIWGKTIDAFNKNYLKSSIQAFSKLSTETADMDELGDTFQVDGDIDMYVPDEFEELFTGGWIGAKYGETRVDPSTAEVYDDGQQVSVALSGNMIYFPAQKEKKDGEYQLGDKQVHSNQYELVYESNAWKVSNVSIDSGFDGETVESGEFNGDGVLSFKNDTDEVYEGAYLAVVDDDAVNKLISDELSAYIKAVQENNPDLFTPYLDPDSDSAQTVKESIRDFADNTKKMSVTDFTIEDWSRDGNILYVSTTETYEETDNDGYTDESTAYNDYTFKYVQPKEGADGKWLIIADEVY